MNIYINSYDNPDNSRDIHGNANPVFQSLGALDDGRAGVFLTCFAFTLGRVSK